jgi:hypothetical protein
MIYPHTAQKVHAELVYTRARASHINTDHWLQFKTGTHDGSIKMAVCNIHISTGTEVSTFDDKTYKSMHIQ